ncbi:MAG: right-handed parallel beta-helix repeat-containing protein, partial [Euryarchaeota archaeon]|nr:right-handed parallel beta-helix repeat-containing protein [Euryarchaeota archaeon]
MRLHVIALALLVLPGIGGATCEPPSAGTWAINPGETCSISNSGGTLSGSLEVSGTLVLANVDFRINATAPGSVRLNVSPTGTLTVSGGQIVPSDQPFTFTSWGFLSLQDTAISTGKGLQFYSGNNTLRNVTITAGSSSGLLLQGAGGSTIRDSTVASSNLVGIVLSGSTGNTLENLTLLSNSKTGVHVLASTGNTLARLAVTGSGEGMLLQDSADTTVANLTVTGPTTGVRVLRSRNSTLRDIFVDTAPKALEAVDSSGARVTNLTLNGVATGANLSNATGFEFHASALQGADGLRLGRSTANLTSTTLAGTQRDLWLQGASQANLTNTTFETSRLLIEDTSEAQVGWTLGVRITGAGGYPITGASVEVRNASGGVATNSSLLGRTTDSDGWLRDIPVPMTRRNSTGEANQTPHTIEASYPTLTTNKTNTTAEIIGPRNVTLTLNASDATPLDASPPLVQITSPASGATLLTNPVTVTVQVNGTGSNASALLQVNGANLSSQNLGQENGTLTFTATLAQGSNTLVAFGLDAAGNLANHTITVTLLLGSGNDTGSSPAGGGGGGGALPTPPPT